VPRTADSPRGGLTYAAAGIDLDKRATLVENIRALTRADEKDNVLAGVGPFASLFSLAGYRDPVIGASVDSVGTKLRLAVLLERYEGVGIDIVNHCVNDVLTSGAQPLFFLDYIGSSELGESAKLELIRGMTRACDDANCVLIGGETADMPDIYAPGDFDLVGILIGACERSDLLDPSSIGEGDVLLGLPSNGLHTNGYSLVRRVFNVGCGGPVHDEQRRLQQVYTELGESLGEALLRPHRSYLAELKPVLNRLKALAHITGGGIAGNVARIVPKGLSGVIAKGSWPVLPVFDLIARTGKISNEEMYRVFNMGLGMVLVAAPRDAEALSRDLPEALRIGQVVSGQIRVELREV
jgi:phosphoribosylformylglycinamidine cyclo-ligase